MKTTSILATQITCGWHELEGKAVGDRVTVTKYLPAKVGSGMDRAGQVTGVIVGMADQPTRCHGCSFVWREAEIRVE